MDEKDTKIIEALKKDSSMSIASIAKDTNLPHTTVHNRIKKLKESGIVINYTINLDKARLYGNIISYVLIKVINVDQRSVVSELLKHDIVEEAAIITGENDIIAKIRVKSIDQLNSFILDYLRRYPGIQNSKTMISLEYHEKL